MDENELAAIVVDTCFQLHVKYGPGLLESVYEELVYFELRRLNLNIRRQVAIPLVHDKLTLEVSFRADLIIENLLLVELKSVEKLSGVHFKQTLTYLKLTKLRLGLLINFNEILIKDGIKRVVNKL